MVLFNYATRELTAKVVYYGAGLCGKTTNLEHIHKSLPEKSRGKMLSLATQTDRTLFFDFLPLDLGSIKGMKTRVQLYTVPGQVFYDATRKLVLKGADGVVFVVDSQREMLESNLESWENLKQNLAENNLDIHAIPLVIQYNKLDLPNVLPVKELNQRINVLKVPFFEAVALTGMGVQETLKGIAKIVMKTLARKYAREEPEEAPQVVAAVSREASNDRIKPLPTDETLDLTALDEEVKELPQVEDLEITEEPLNLEPLETIEESQSLGQVEDVPELHEITDLPEHDIPEIPIEPLQVKESSPTPPSQPVAKTKAERPSSSGFGRSSSEVDQIFSQVQAAVTGQTASRSRKSSSARNSDQRDFRQAEESVEVKAGTTRVSPQDVDVPVEISVGREGQDVKLQISITLKIRVKD